MIINRTKDFFGGLTTIIAGKNKSFNFDGQYGVSTAKAGLFSGLSTRVSEFPKGSFINYRTISEFIYEDHVTKNERYEIHDDIVKILDEDIIMIDDNESLIDDVSDRKPMKIKTKKKK